MHLTLFIPGLFGPRAAFSAGYIPAAPALGRILGRARHGTLPAEPISCSLARTFGYQPPVGRDFPVAAVSRLVDAGGPEAGCWMRADPIHLRPDRHGLVLVDAPALNLPVRDALALASEVRRALAEKGWTLEVPDAERWYVKLDAAADMRSHDLEEMVGRDIQGALPTGPDAAAWHLLINDIQMQFHGSEVNRRREDSGEPVVNSLWFWGIGELPAATDTAWTRVYTGEVLARGLAALSSVPVAAEPESFSDVAAAAGPGDRVLVVLSACRAPARYHDVEAWSNAIGLLEQHWLAPVLRALEDGETTSLDLIADRHTFHLSRAALLRFWRRDRVIGDYREG